MKLSGSAKHLHFPCLVFPRCGQKVGFNPLVRRGVRLLRALQLGPTQTPLGNWLTLGSSFAAGSSSRVIFGDGCWRVEGSAQPGTASKEPRRARLFPRAEPACSPKPGRRVSVAGSGGSCGGGSRRAQLQRETPAPVCALGHGSNPSSGWGKTQASPLQPYGIRSGKPACVH